MTTQREKLWIAEAETYGLRLTGRIADLSHFMAKSAEKALPFFKTLWGASKLEWTTKYQVAFESLKAYL
ncbi:hypothetical protein E2562_012736 [Oryza meyeriana var. granulata]|uniref:Uncharacterized protein n=1 Tax=Oryza meyeriana var. granulata TaxID=110450 RepID=A0A6G1DHK7_9ORYZ|nr:hypothetical protein E2562_012736 [Oryza meyeriana var. granulata]